MTVKGQIIDGSTKEPLAGASITVIDTNGKFLGQGIIADASGVFSFSSPLIDTNLVAVSFAGYHSLAIEPALLKEYRVIQLYDVENDLSEVEVVAKRPKNYVPAVVLGSFVVIGTMAGFKK